MSKTGSTKSVKTRSSSRLYLRCAANAVKHDDQSVELTPRELAMEDEHSCQVTVLPKTKIALEKYEETEQLNDPDHDFESSRVPT